MLPARQRSAVWLWWAVPIVAIGGWWYPYLGLGVLACMLGPVIVAVARGRYWCGWLCPRGAFFDYVMARFSAKRPVPAWLRSRGFRWFAIAFLMGMMGGQLVLAYPNPAAMARVFVVLLGVTTLVGIGLALAYTPRAWCTICPMGTMSSWVSHGKRSLQVSSACRNCNACSKVCPMGLIPFQPDASHADCIKCGQCVQRCPVNALTFDQEVTSSSQCDISGK